MKKNEMKIFLVPALTLLALVCSCNALAARVDTISVFSNAMHKNSRCVIIEPEHLEGERLPVLYLLHGFGGDHQAWLRVKPDLPRLADSLKLMIVCPNGERSWYLDSPVDSAVRFETYMTRELIPFIDEHYATIGKRDARAIAGLSMGGHGCLYLAFRHPDLYAAVCATSGSVNLLRKTYTYKYRELILGSEQEHSINWSGNSILTLAGAVQPGTLHIMVDCGTEDEWLEENRRLHQILLDRKVPHDFVERPGGHDAEYWNNSIDYILLFVGKHIALK